MMQALPPDNLADLINEHPGYKVPVLIGGIEFEGPYSSEDDIENLPGLFGIVCEFNGELELLEIDESICLKDCLTGNEYESNMLFYSENCPGTLAAVVYYTPTLSNAERRALKTDVQNKLAKEFY